MGCGFPALVCFCFSQIDEYEALAKIYINSPNIYIRFMAAILFLQIIFFADKGN